MEKPNKKQLKLMKKIKPQMLWDILYKKNPETMEKTEIMLKCGISPEWILSNRPMDTAPKEFVTLCLKCLKWKAKEINAPIVN